MIDLTFDAELRRKLPEFALGCLKAEVEVAESGDALKALMTECAKKLESTYSIETLYVFEPVLGTRLAYKKLGKDPSRYRPSAEALQRRIVQGKGLYFVSNVVDCLNLMAFETGYSIGGWDLEQIKGPVRAGIGVKDEPYETIGRGPMNIEGFPVLRDRLGAFGNPTSDSARTMVRPETRQFLMAFYAFEGGGDFIKLLDRAATLLQDHAGGKFIETKIYKAY